MSPINNSKLHQREGNELPLIRRFGQCLSLPREYRDLLADGLYVLLNRPVHDDAHGYNATLQAEPLFPPGRFANSGLIRVLQYVAIVEKQRLFVWDHERLQCNEARRTTEIEYPEAIRFISYYEHGIIRVSHVNDIADIIIDVIRCYSSDSSRIVIIGKGKLLHSVYKKVQQHITPSYADQLNIQCYTDRIPFDKDQDFPRVAFATPHAAAELDSGKCSIAIILDASSCLQQGFENFLSQDNAMFRVYGFLQVGRQPTPYEQVHLNRVFGFEQIEFGSHGRVRRQVSYRFTTIGGSCPRNAVFPQKGRNGEPLVNSMRAYVLHKRRNRKIVGLAKRLVQEYRNTLLILVENLDHANQLGSELPGWPIYARPLSECNLDGIPRSIQRRINPNVDLGFMAKGVIVVADGFEQYRGETARAIIWAGGGKSIPIPRAWLFEKGLQDRPLTVYDFQDNFSRESRLASNRRRERLHELEIYESRKEPWVERVRRFLKNVIRNPAGYEVAE